MATMAISAGGRLWTAALTAATDGECYVTFPAIPNLVTKADKAAVAKSAAEDCLRDYLATFDDDKAALAALVAAEQQVRTELSMKTWDMEQELAPADPD